MDLGTDPGRVQRTIRPRLSHLGFELQLALDSPSIHAQAALLDTLAQARVCQVTHGGDDLTQSGGDIGLLTDVGGKAPHRKIGFERIHINVRPMAVSGGLTRLRQPGHIDIKQKSKIGLG